MGMCVVALSRTRAQPVFAYWPNIVRYKMVSCSPNLILIVLVFRSDCINEKTAAIWMVGACAEYLVWHMGTINCLTVNLMHTHKTHPEFSFSIAEVKRIVKNEDATKDREAFAISCTLRRKTRIRSRRITRKVLRLFIARFCLPHFGFANNKSREKMRQNERRRGFDEEASVNVVFYGDSRHMETFRCASIIQHVIAILWLRRWFSSSSLLIRHLYFVRIDIIIIIFLLKRCKFI